MTTTATKPNTFTIGQEVIIDPQYARRSDIGVVYVITKVPTNAREVNYIATRKDSADVPGVRGRAEVFMPVPEGGPLSAEATMVPYIPTPTPGTIVRAIADLPGVKIKTGDLFAVLGETPRGMKIARLGGDVYGGFTGVPVRYFEVVPLSNIVIG